MGVDAPERFAEIGMEIDAVIQDAINGSEPTCYETIRRNPSKELVVIPGNPASAIYGPSGTGKNTFQTELIRRGLAVKGRTGTTRERRVSLDEPEDAYTWMVPIMNPETATPEELETIKAQLIKDYDLLEINYYGLHFYGFPKDNLNEALGRGPVAIVTENGGANVIEGHLSGNNTVVKICIVPGSFDELLERMDQRINVAERIGVMRNEISEAVRNAHFLVFNRTVSPEDFAAGNVPALHDVCALVEQINAQCLATAV